ncbi:secologanin synthase 1-like [Cornus florida]|uniref:secologanin synthase 1-like n=1 Tax=Cornus florida TaxID=4283 RepID=UPI0028A060B2|nr:secologanin synthase 1-like [Cornus florida]
MIAPDHSNTMHTGLCFLSVSLCVTGSSWLALTMEVLMYKSIVATCAIVFLLWAWRFLNRAWLTPKRIENHLRQQGFRGNPYRLMVGDMRESSTLLKETMSKPINISDDIVRRLLPHVVKTIDTYGKKSFTWLGRMPRVHIMEPNIMKEILANYESFPKNHHVNNKLTKLLLSGTGSLEGHEWAKHRKLMNPSFHQEKLKNMMPAFYACYDEDLTKWEESCKNGSIEIDVYQTFSRLTGQVISRVGFGPISGGERIYELMKDQIELTVELMRTLYIPIWSDVLPTKRNQKIRAIDKEVRDRFRTIINSRLMAVEEGKPWGDDLLGTLLESNFKEIERQGNKKNAGLCLDEIISECKLLYFAGQDSAASLLAWTCVLLCRHQDWQEQAREEVLQLFGKEKLDFNRVQNLKIVTMILNEVLRLYPPVIEVTRVTHEDAKFGDLTIPAGVQLMIPTILLHRDQEMWGKDAEEFNPGRFAEGISNATKNPFFYLPFAMGPRICPGQNLALLQAKMALAMILQRFSFQLSPSYAHGPFTMLSLQPQYGAQVVFHKLNH